MTAGNIIALNEDANSKKGNYFDGADDYVLHDAHAVARVAANDTVGTYTAWIYLDKVSVTGTILSAGDNSSANEFLRLTMLSSGVLSVLLQHAGATQFRIDQTTANINSREWTHVAVVQDGTQPKLYVNGKNVAATNSVSTDLTFWYDELTLVDKFAIGVLESNATHTQDFKGAIGQVKYFNIALSDDEILNEFKGKTDSNALRAAEIETARVFDISMEDDGTTDSGSGADDGTFVGDAHYGREISTHSIALERNITGHAAEEINSFLDGNKVRTLIKRGD